MKAMPIVQDTRARAQVFLISVLLFELFIRPKLPGWLQLFAVTLRDQAPRLLEDISWTLVRRGRSAAPATVQ